MSDDELDKMEYIEDMVELNITIKEGRLFLEELYDMSDSEASPHAIAGEIEGVMARSDLLDETDVDIHATDDTLRLEVDMETEGGADGKMYAIYYITSTLIRMAMQHDVKHGSEIMAQVAMEAKKHVEDVEDEIEDQ